MTQRHLHLAIALDGVGWHPAAWREDAANARRIADHRYWLEQVRTAQAGLIDFVTFEDRLVLQGEGYGPAEPRDDRLAGRVDAVLLAARVAPQTQHIGLVPTIVTAHTEPFHLAKAIATLDHVSGGRAGVRLNAGASAAEARLIGTREIPEFSLETLDDPDVAAAIGELFAEAGDYAEVLHRLWDSWEDDAEIRDVATGRFVDRRKLHHIDFAGRFFSVKGPSIVPRPPQGQPIVSVLGHGPGPYRLGAETSDVLYVTPQHADDAERVLDEVREQEAQAGRSGDPLLVFADVLVVLDRDPARARARLDRLDELDGEPLRSDAHVFAGSPARLADLLEVWARAGGAGVRLRPAANAVDLPAITQELVPELQRRGRYRIAYESTTLRGLLGLPRPQSRYALEVAR
jgi:alkanesulfonate monooxygenase SsuD/methylene tetrahydromethanopterin reductase-like flavin-dependent oxidoreductase (luciferase family)